VGNLETAELLIEKGASVNAIANDELTPLHYAAGKENSETAKLLIEKGACVNALAKDGTNSVALDAAIDWRFKNSRINYRERSKC
jgi:ankyrin repeat protein